jgi:hypothetical protein
VTQDLKLSPKLEEKNENVTLDDSPFPRLRLARLSRCKSRHKCKQTNTFTPRGKGLIETNWKTGKKTFLNLLKNIHKSKGNLDCADFYDSNKLYCIDMVMPGWHSFRTLDWRQLPATFSKLTRFV